MEVFGIGGGELLLLLVLGIILFGPEKLPEFSRKAARFIHAMRLLAQQATDQLKEELGPEYSDLTLADLHPKTLVRKKLLAEFDEDIEQIKADLGSVRDEFTGVANEFNQARTDLGQSAALAATAGSTVAGTAEFGAQSQENAVSQVADVAEATPQTQGEPAASQEPTVLSGPSQDELAAEYEQLIESEADKLEFCFDEDAT